MERLRVIVGGYIGLYPTGGATWDYIQYPFGLKLLGHDVYYIEDTMQYPVYQKNKAWDDASASVEYLKNVMTSFGMEERWAYRDIASGECYGMSLQKVNEICSTADVFINISCSTFMRDEYASVSKRILIDSDPMFTQIQYYKEREGELKTSTKELILSHNYLFSFGENIGADDCKIPDFNFTWLATRQPVCLDLWAKKNGLNKYGFSSIMNWSGRQKLNYNNEEWGQKDVEFMKFIDVPACFPELQFDVVINPPLNEESDYDPIYITKKQWHILHPKHSVSSPGQYQNFIKTSFAEFSVAKETYVKSNSGWFSCRSACYLAAGKPVIAEETGWSKYIPEGKGLFSFTDVDTAIESIKSVALDWNKHSKAAVEIANDFFDSKIVLTDMINKLN